MAKAVHAPPFLVDHEYRRATGDRLHFARKFAKLFRVSDIAAKQDDGVRSFVAKNLSFEIAQRLAGQADAQNVHEPMLTVNSKQVTVNRRISILLSVNCYLLTCPLGAEAHSTPEWASSHRAAARATHRRHRARANRKAKAAAGQRRDDESPPPHRVLCARVCRGFRERGR